MLHMIHLTHAFEISSPSGRRWSADAAFLDEDNTLMLHMIHLTHAFELSSPSGQRWSADAIFSGQRQHSDALMLHMIHLTRAFELSSPSGRRWSADAVFPDEGNTLMLRMSLDDLANLRDRPTHVNAPVTAFGAMRADRYEQVRGDE